MQSQADILQGGLIPYARHECEGTLSRFISLSSFAFQVSEKRSRDCDTNPAASAQTFGGRVRISHQRSAAIIVGQFFSLSRISKSLLSIFLTFSFYLEQQHLT